MAKEKQELMNDLQNGIHSFTLIGKVKLLEKNGLKGPSNKEGKTWYSVNSSFGVEIGDGNIVYPRINGGYSLDNPFLKRFSKKSKEMITIPYADRHNENLLKNCADSVFLRGGLAKGEDGKPVLERFIDAIDFEAYLAEHLTDGLDIKVMGTVEYSPGENVYRNYEVSSVFLNEEYQKGEETIPKKDPIAFIRQTYLLDDSALEKGWEKEYKETGETNVSVYVPQYLSKRRKADGTYAEWKKTSPIPQNIVFKNTAFGENISLESQLKLANLLFSVKRGKVRELNLFVSINEGYSTQTGDIEISAEMQELIDMGLVSEDEIKTQVTVRGSRISELLYSKPVFVKDDDSDKPRLALTDEKYSEQALVFPDMDDEDEEEEITSNASDSVYGDDSDDSSNIDFDQMFG